MNSVWEAIMMACREAANEIGSEELKGLSWFYRKDAKVRRSVPLKKAA